MLNKEETRKLILEVIDEVEPIVIASMGALGSNACIVNEFGLPSVVDDGITIAKGIKYEDPYKQAILDLLIQSSEETNKVVGDSSTLSFLLPCEMTRLAMKSEKHPVVLRKELQEVSEEVIKQIEKRAIKITTKKQKKQIATISAKDENIGQIVADSMQKVGDVGYISIEEGKGFGMELEHIEGMQFGKGFLSPHFSTSEFVIEDARVLVLDQKIDDVNTVSSLLNVKKLLIICNGVDDMTLATLLRNNVKGTKLLAVQAPGFGGTRTELLKDIASYTNTKLVADGTGVRLDEITVEDLGYAKKVTSSIDKTIILGGEGDTSGRVEEIKRQLEDATGYDKNQLEERLAKLTKGMVTIKVGGATKTEIEETMLSVEDAVNAAKAAVKGGIVDGGGVTLYDIILRDSEAECIFSQALSMPLFTILNNAGLEPNRIAENLYPVVNGKPLGFNVVTNKYVDMIEEGIIDPALAPITAIRNATAVTGTLISMNSMTIKKKLQD